MSSSTTSAPPPGTQDPPPTPPPRPAHPLALAHRLAACAAQGLAALLAGRAAAAVLPGVPLSADDRQRDRVPPVRAGRFDPRRVLGGPALRRDVPVRPDVLAGLPEHPVDRRTDAPVLLPGPDRARPAAQRGPPQVTETIRAVGVLPAALPVHRDRRRHHDADARHGRPGQPCPRLVRARPGPVHPGARLVPRHLRRLRDLADRPAGARSSTSPRSPPSTRTCTRPPGSTARTAGGRSGTSPCPASAPP